MAALPLLKLLCKTCSCSVNPAHYIPTIRFLSLERDSTHSIESKKSVDRKRSYSTPSRSSLNKVSKKGKEQCIQVRKISRSVENLRNYKSKDDNEIPAFRYSKPKAVLDVEDVAANEDLELSASEMEPIESEPPKPEMNFENNVRYELTSTQSTEQNFSDVMSHMRQYEQKKPYKIFPHLQPFNMKPYGSNDTMLFPTVPKAGVQIVYPSNAFIAGSRVSNEGPSDVVHELEMPEPTTIDRGFERDLSSYAQEKEYPGYEEAKKMVVCETPSKTQQSLSRKSYSTAAVHTPPSKPKPPPQDDNFAFQRFSKSEKEPPKPVLRHALLKEVRSVVAEKKEEALKAKPAPPLPVRRYKIGELLVNSALKLDLPKATTKSIMDKVKMDAFYSSWTGIDLKNENIRNKKSAKPTKCGTSEVERPQVMAKKTRSHSKNPTKITYSTTLLSRSRHALQLQSTSSRNLAKTYTTSSKNSKKNDEDCCKQYVTVKLGELQEECIKAGKCRPPKPKTGRLPKFVPADCPCAQDPPLAIGKPLAPLKKRYTPKDPPWTCNKLKKCNIPRADEGLRSKKKTLPKLTVQDCPCTVQDMTDLVIRRLPKRKAPEPKRTECPVPCSKKTPRADAGLKVSPKQLPKLVPADCPCPPQEKLKDKPLARLVPRPVKPPVRICPRNELCDIPRADVGLKVVTKKLPPHIPPECPCPPEPKDVPVPILKRLNLSVPEPKRKCVIVKCGSKVPRADAGLKVIQKKLPVLKSPDCPCPDPIELKSIKLVRLVPRPVKEPPKICPKEDVCSERADKDLRPGPKKLPIHVAPDCPCPVEPELKEMPLVRLPQVQLKDPPRICPKVTLCIVPRADEGLKVAAKKLQPHKPPDCPCPPSREMKTKKLARLVPRPVAEPVRVCPSDKPCDDVVRADDGLKILPKKLPVHKPPECPCPEEPELIKVKLARLKMTTMKEPKRICPVIDVCEVAVRADKDDWLYWRHPDCCKPKICVPSVPKSTKNTKNTKTTKNTKSTKNTKNTKNTMRRSYSTLSSIEHKATSHFQQTQEIFEVKRASSLPKPSDRAQMRSASPLRKQIQKTKEQIQKTKGALFDLKSKRCAVTKPVDEVLSVASLPEEQVKSDVSVEYIMLEKQQVYCDTEDNLGCLGNLCEEPNCAEGKGSFHMSENECTRSSFRNRSLRPEVQT